MNSHRCLLAALTLGGVCLAARATTDRVAHESFPFDLAGRRITVWCHVPSGATAQSPVVVVMHGVGRNGEDYLNDWMPHAETHRFVLVVPEFSKKEFPGVECYNYGNTVDKAGRPLPRAQWSFSALEPIFDAVKVRTGNRSARYRLFGHSAGAQFVQRFIYFVPAARVERVVAANAGWYVLPDFSTAFPYGLKNTAVTEADLRQALALPMTVLIGTADTDPVLHALRHTPEADAQGPDRLARGKFFFARAEEAARGRQIRLGWHWATAPNVDHSDQRMAPFAVKLLLPDPP
jgi:poly(3-hydroxybutyrate) depolymerase